jgi:hypothetical protein
MGQKWNIEHRDHLRALERRTRSRKRQSAAHSLPDDLRHADAVIAAAHELRKEIRRKVPKSPERDERIDHALKAIRDAMRPIRSAQSRYVYDMAPVEHQMAVRRASEGLQEERHALWRMKS